MVVRRGEIWWAELSAPTGSEPGFRRPVAIVQSDAFNRSGIGKAVVVVLTSNFRLANAPGNVVIPKSASGLPKDSVANVSQIVTVDLAQLARREGKLPELAIRSIDRGIRLVLDL